jgi:tetratricopeptide (TPR) repeat protein
MHDRDFKHAAKEYSKAIALAPHEPAAYFELGVAYGSSGLPQMAGPAFVESMGLYSHGCQEWAFAAASAIEAYTGLGHLAVTLPDTRPKWMKTFEGLKANSRKIIDALAHNKATHEASRTKYQGNGRVTKARLNNACLEIADFKSRAWACRGNVLASSNDMSDLREAQQCYQNAADVLPADDPNRYMRVARAVQLRNVLNVGCSRDMKKSM